MALRLVAILSHRLHATLYSTRVAYDAEGLRNVGLAEGFGAAGRRALLTVMAGRLLAQQAYSVSDLPWMLAAVASLLLILTLLACWVPLRRALALDPVIALRSE
jgi:ABC-type antimicrobial peptide transport system permease subunit